MAKLRKKNLSEKLQNQKQPTKKQLNPFEVHINKAKLTVLGRKSNNDRGLPGVSRAKAIKKRKSTLLQEYKQLNKSNKFLDKRIGEKNQLVNDEDRTIARYAAVRMKAHKKSIFNLSGDPFVLTHRGQSLSEVEKFEDVRSDDDEDEDFNKTGNLDSKFVEEAHFGGGILTRTNREGARTHKDLIEQLIAESKKRKAEKQKTREATLELTEKLDSEWKDLLPIVRKSNKTEDYTAKVSDYDKVMRELRFEAKGTVSDRLKTDDEVAKEEEEKLKQLEKERLERMRGCTDDSKTQNHKSADDLDDDFNYESDPEYMLTYNKDGEANVEVSAEINGKPVEEKGDEEMECEEDSEAETESEDNLSDLKADTSESEDSETAKVDEAETEEKPQKSEEIKSDLLKRKEIMDKARQELPYTFSIPASYEDLQQLLEKHSNDHKSVIIERMIKCNHSSLKEGNKENLEHLFVYLMQFLNDLASLANTAQTVKDCFDCFAVVLPHLGELAKLSPDNARTSLKETIKEKHEEYRRKKRHVPGLEMLLFFRIAFLFYSTSDFRHEIATPCFMFIEQILSNCKFNSKRDISYGLFVATLILEATSLSKRFLPATINFLAGLLHMAIPKVGVRLIKVTPPFKATSNCLVLHEKFAELDLKMQVTDLVNSEIDDNYKIRAISTTVKLMQAFSGNFVNLPSNIEIFQPLIGYLEQIPAENYPESVQTQFKTTLDLFNKQKIDRKLYYVVMEAKKPKALRLYEPKIEQVFDRKRHRIQSKEKAERDKMVHKLKKETKGALREIRRDKAFLGRVKIQQRIKSDKERRDKVKRIYAEAAMQQSELNSMDRKKKKK